MPRDDFPQLVKDRLAQRVGYLCSNPDCRALTKGPSTTDAEGTVNIGVAAHITAASPGGPRYNENITHEQRSSLSNGIWLCQNCAALIDRDVEAYPTLVLWQWKDDAEKEAANRLGVCNWASSKITSQKASILVEHYNLPPFALALQEPETPECYFGLDHRDIPINWNSTWIDQVRIHVTISNPLEANSLVIDDLTVEETPLEDAYQSGIMFIAQGVKRALEYVIPIDGRQARPCLVECDRDKTRIKEPDFFAHNTIVIPPGDAETLILTFGTLGENYLIKPRLHLVENGKRRIVGIPECDGIKLISATCIPEDCRKWTIHLDGRANGDGFLQRDTSLLERCLAN